MDNDGDDGHKRRISALRALTDNQQKPAPLVSPTSLPHNVLHRSRRLVLLWVSVGALLVILFSSGVFIWLHTLRPPPAPDDPLVIHFPSGGISCPIESAWSPDGKSIAVLGYSTCAGPQPRTNAPAITPATVAPTGGVLTIFNATSGAVARTIRLDAWIAPQSLPSYKQNGSTEGMHPIYNYFHILWAPDGQRVAMLFDVVGVDQRSATQDYGGGLLLAHVGSGEVNIIAQSGFFHAYQAARESAFTAPTAPSTLRWDVTTGAMDAIHIPPALGYEWGQNGALRPTQLLGKTPVTPSSDATVQPIGNPLGGTRFSIWQRGVVTYASARCSSDGKPADNDHYYVFGTTGTSAWSPDGRYLYLSVGTLGRLAASATPPGDTRNSSVCTQFGPAEKWLQLPVRDAGMASALTLIEPTTNNQVLLSWSPDGTRLAAELAVQTPVTQDTPLITIYDCHSGKMLTRLTAHQLRMQPGLTQTASLSDPLWTPDGSQLLLLKMDQEKGDYNIMVFRRKSLEPAVAG